MVVYGVGLASGSSARRANRRSRCFNPTTKPLITHLGVLCFLMLPVFFFLHVYMENVFPTGISEESEGNGIGSFMNNSKFSCSVFCSVFF